MYSSLPTKKVVAVDFDGTITKKDNRVWTNNVPTNDVMEPNQVVIKKLKEKQEEYYYILWTCRTGESLKRAVRFCQQQGIILQAVNTNLYPYPTSNKILADYYLDDKGGLMECLNKL